MDRIDIYRLADGVYYVDLDFTRYNTSDEILFEGRTLYFFGNETGSWKMFAAAPGKETSNYALALSHGST